MLLNKQSFLTIWKKKINTCHGSVSHFKKTKSQKRKVNVTVLFPGFLGKRDELEPERSVSDISGSSCTPLTKRASSLCSESLLSWPMRI